MSRNLFKFILLVFLLSHLGMAKPKNAPTLWEDVVTIGEILRNPTYYEGKGVKILAYYRWFDLFKECGTGPVLTRSDVVFADVTGAIYATFKDGGVILESSPEATERLYLLKATLHLTKEGRPYLQIKDFKEVRGLPKNVVLRVLKRGGIAGFNKEVLIANDGNALLLDRKLNEHKRFKVDGKEVRKILNTVESHLGMEIGKPATDGISYVIYTWHGEEIDSVTIYDYEVPKSFERILSVLDQLLSK